MLSSATSSGLGMVLGFSAVQTITDGTILFRQGDRPQSASFVVSGWVIGVRVDQDGRERGIALYPPGSLPGLADLFAGQDHSETAIALSSCRLRRINAQTFFNLIETNRQFSEQIFRSLVRQH
jgi:CRP-like cAMP-binding protein